MYYTTCARETLDDTRFACSKHVTLKAAREKWGKSPKGKSHYIYKATAAGKLVKIQ